MRCAPGMAGSSFHRWIADRGKRGRSRCRALAPFKESSPEPPKLSAAASPVAEHAPDHRFSIKAVGALLARQQQHAVGNLDQLDLGAMQTILTASLEVRVNERATLLFGEKRNSQK